MQSIWNENKPTQNHGQMLFKYLLNCKNAAAQENQISRISATENGMETLRLASLAGKLAITKRIAKVNAECDAREYETCGNELNYVLALLDNVMHRENLIRDVNQGTQVVNLLDHFIQLHDLEKVTGVSLAGPRV